MRIIFKYPISNEKTVTIQLPEKATPLRRMVQNGQMHLWAAVDINTPPKEYTLTFDKSGFIETEQPTLLPHDDAEEFLIKATSVKDIPNQHVAFYKETNFRHIGNLLLFTQKENSKRKLLAIETLNTGEDPDHIDESLEYLTTAMTPNHATVVHVFLKYEE